MMKCGHSANAITDKGKPVCVICCGLTPDADIVDENPPDLEQRVARCCYCKNDVPSSSTLPFFEYGGDQSSAPKELLEQRNKMLDGKTYSTEHLKELNKLNRQIHEQATRDAYYCGCQGWD